MEGHNESTYSIRIGFLSFYDTYVHQDETSSIKENIKSIVVERTFCPV
ncbi:hypothetical protein MY9_2028 [Bacillus sp. JS]|nr:hypothetical protein MY9_2028 [Bacillus sp. JS]